MTESKAPSKSNWVLKNNVIDQRLIKMIDLPRVIMERPGNIKERSTIVIHVHHTKESFGQVMKASKDGFEHFKLESIGGKVKDRSSIVFHDAFIKGIDYGTINWSTPEEEQTIQIEISYKLLEIDGVKL